jgi:hypothetical protein
MKKPDPHEVGMIGGIIFAAISSACCILPLLFTALGIGVGAAGILAGRHACVPLSGRSRS